MTESLNKLAVLPTSKKAMILLGILLLIFALYFYFFYMPKHNEIKELQSKRDQLQSVLLKNQVIAKKLTKYREEVKRLDEKLTIALIQLPNKKEIPSLLTNVSNLGRETELEFLFFKPLPEVEQEFYAEVPVDIKVLGKFHQVFNFFDKVSKLTRIINITNLSMSNAKTPDEGDTLTVSCLATTFKFLEKEEKSETKKNTGK
ncbi:MAG: type 4a pilus biogenesis protein PilO [Pseudomonadota bacterium]